MEFIPVDVRLTFLHGLDWVVRTGFSLILIVFILSHCVRKPFYKHRDWREAVNTVSKSSTALLMPDLCVVYSFPH